MTYVFLVERYFCCRSVGVGGSLYFWGGLGLVFVKKNCEIYKVRTYVCENRSVPWSVLLVLL